MKVSVICATLGPANEIDFLIRSVIHALQRVDSILRVEFILIDQSDDFSGHCFPISDRLDLIHIRNPIKGLSLNRNIGLGRVSGEWVMLIDSDCAVSEDYFRNFLSLHQTYSDVSHFMGRIVKSNSTSPLFRNWPTRVRRLSKWMMWYCATSVNSIFEVGADRPCFDERFGLGAKYGSCEDIDFFLNLKRTCLYSPDLAIFHPDLIEKGIARKKLNAYSFGFGALCAKHAFSLGVAMLLASLIKKLVDMLRGKATPMDFACAVVYRAKGFVRYVGDQVRGWYA
jgi:glycosyltransferase involved in cell wall biosynthesis